MADFAFSVLWIIAFSALQVISLPWGEIKRLKETVSTIEAVLQDVEQSLISEDPEIWLKQLDVALKNASDLLYEIELRSQGILFSEKFILKTLGGYTFWNLILFCHYGARLVLIFQSCEQLKTRISVRTIVRSKTPVYVFLYLIVSHVIGASWYYLSIKRQLSCWNYACKIITGCIFHCDSTTPSTLNSTLYDQFCPINPPNAAVFNYGIYLDALQSRIVEEEGVLKKFLRCFFWGLRNLSSFGSNLHTSTNGGETFFAIIISGVALILLIYILGNIQVGFPVESRSANSETARVDSSSRTEEGASVQRTEEIEV